MFPQVQFDTPGHLGTPQPASCVDLVLVGTPRLHPPCAVDPRTAIRVRPRCSRYAGAKRDREETYPQASERPQLRPCTAVRPPLCGRTCRSRCPDYAGCGPSQIRTDLTRETCSPASATCGTPRGRLSP